MWSGARHPHTHAATPTHDTYGGVCQTHGKWSVYVFPPFFYKKITNLYYNIFIQKRPPSTLVVVSATHSILYA